MSASIALDGIVGWDITAADIRAALAEAGPEVALHINSPGGDVHEGVAAFLEKRAPAFPLTVGADMPDMPWWPEAPELRR